MVKSHQKKKKNKKQKPLERVQMREKAYTQFCVTVQ